METFAYLHHALEYETGLEDAAQEMSEVCGLQGSVNRTRSNLGLYPLLALALLPLAILGVEAKAWALQYGDEGAEVAALQARLLQARYLDVEPTGLYLELTEEAVAKFQQDRGLQVDGIAGIETLTTLGLPRPLGSSTTISAESSSALNSEGFSLESLSQQTNVLPMRSRNTVSPQIPTNVKSFNPIEQNLVVNLRPTVSATVFLRSKNFNSFWSSVNLRDCRTTFKEAIAKNEAIATRGKKTLCLQNMLVKLGYLEDVNIDAMYSLITEEAVRNFQQNKGLEIDGKAGAETLEELVRDTYYSEERVFNSDYFWLW
jgi:peptidoglycan hydrolase-like protein with peptidoglycan-binding domain